MLTIQPLTGSHNRNLFDCGSEDLNGWLREHARQHQQRGTAKTFVAVEGADPKRILGFYALVASEIRRESLPPELASKLPRIIPAVRLGRLAVDVAVQGQGLGEHLLIDAMKRTCEVLQHIGVNVLLVDAKDEKAAAFYRKYGFKAFPDNPLRLAIPLANVQF